MEISAPFYHLFTIPHQHTSSAAAKAFLLLVYVHSSFSPNPLHVQLLVYSQAQSPARYCSHLGSAPSPAILHGLRLEAHPQDSQPSFI